MRTYCPLRRDTAMKHEGILFLLAFTVFLCPQLLRIFSGDMNIIGYPTYRLARVTEIVTKGSFYDPLSYQGSLVVYPPGYFFVLGTVYVAMDIDVYAAAAILGPLVGALSSIILCRMYSRRVFTIFVLAPATIYLFSHAGSRVPPFLFGIMALYFYKKHRHNLSAFHLLLSSMAHPEVSAIFLVLIALDSRRSLAKLSPAPLAKLSLACILPPLSIVLLFGLPVQNLLHQEYALPARSTLHTSAFEDIISLFDNPYAALSLPLALLALLSCRTWERRNPIFFAFILALSLLMQRFAMYLGFAAALISAKAVGKMRAKTFILLAALMVPYVLQEIAWVSGIGPDRCFISLMPDGGSPDETVLVNWAFGHWVETFAGKKTFMDASAEYEPGVDRRFSDFMAIYTYGNATSMELLESNSIDYVLVLDSDYSYFSSRGLPVSIGSLGMTVLKNATCGTLYSVD